MAHPGYAGIELFAGPAHPENQRTYLNRLAAIANRLNQGRANTIIDVTLTANTTTTTVTDARLHLFQGAYFDPLTANAAAELAAGTLYALTANRRNGVWTLTHANSAQTDRSFRMIISG